VRTAPTGLASARAFIGALRAAQHAPVFDSASDIVTMVSDDMLTARAAAATALHAFAGDPRGWLPTLASEPTASIPAAVTVDLTSSEARHSPEKPRCAAATPSSRRVSSTLAMSRSAARAKATDRSTSGTFPLANSPRPMCMVSSSPARALPPRPGRLW
jgi:hypothetical protein